LAKTGNSIAAKIAIMAITTSNSIRVNPLYVLFNSISFISVNFPADRELGRQAFSKLDGEGAIY